MSAFHGYDALSADCDARACPTFGPRDWRQLKVFAWFLLIINLCIVGIGALFSRTLEYPEDGVLLVLAVAALVDGSFVTIVGVNVLIAIACRWISARKRTG